MKRAKIHVVKEKKESIIIELANWFKNSNYSLFLHEAVAEKINRLKKVRGLNIKQLNGKDYLPYSEYGHWLSKTRNYMIREMGLVIINVQIGKERRGGYKLATDAEATTFGVRRYKKFMIAAEGIRDITPLMKRQFITASIKLVFHEAADEANKFKRLGDRFLLAYDKDDKAAKEMKKLLEQSENKEERK